MKYQIELNYFRHLKEIKQHETINHFCFNFIKILIKIASIKIQIKQILHQFINKVRFKSS